ncbi:fibronectin type III domain-containing protein [Salinibius halmophilus]|uniref:fibronectin type III domain-containing protein n=1 Tax=Salinibius halmophilus TaxID=1853216 RepID=UPI000E667B91|nr:fibronectin type III domain-containing protein [Salinibius halmophilus]
MKKNIISSSISLLLGASLSGIAQAEISPYLQTVTEQSIWVNWISDTEQSPAVRFGADSDELTKVAVGTTEKLGDNYYYHSVQLTNLLPSQHYYYQAYSETDSSDVARFKTLPVDGDSDTTTRVLVIGDHQIIDDPRHQKLVAAGKAKIETQFGQPIEDVVDLMVNFGDQVHYGTLEQYKKLSALTSRQRQA